MPIPDSTQLRRGQRHALSARVRITWHDANHRVHFDSGQTINISTAGMAILTDHEIPVRAVVGFDIPKMRLKGSASVRYIWRRGLKQIVGLEFAGMFRWNPDTNNSSSH